MAAYYFKGQKIVVPFQITSNEPIYDVTSISLKTQRLTQTYQRWELSFEVISSGRDNANSLIDSFSGFSSSDTMIMPQMPDFANLYTVDADPLVLAPATAGENQVTLSKVSTSGFLPKGSFVKFSNHDKIYITLTDVDFDDVPAAAVSLYPTLRSDVDTTTTFHTGDNVVMTYYRDISDVKGIRFTDGVLSSPGTIRIIEAV